MLEQFNFRWRVKDHCEYISIQGHISCISGPVTTQRGAMETTKQTQPQPRLLVTNHSPNHHTPWLLPHWYQNQHHRHQNHQRFTGHDGHVVSCPSGLVRRGNQPHNHHRQHQLSSDWLLAPAGAGGLEAVRPPRPSGIHQKCDRQLLSSSSPLKSASWLCFVFYPEGCWPSHGLFNTYTFANDYNGAQVWDCDSSSRCGDPEELAGLSTLELQHTSTKPIQFKLAHFSWLHAWQKSSSFFSVTRRSRSDVRQSVSQSVSQWGYR